MRSLNLDQLRTLSEVIALGSFSAAARRLNLTQPAVTLQVRQLERCLGVNIGTVETVMHLVALGLGMSMVPDIAVAEPMPGVVVRPLNLPVPCTLALVEQRDKSDGPALQVVRRALLALQAPVAPVLALDHDGVAPRRPRVARRVVVARPSRPLARHTDAAVRADRTIAALAS